MTRSTKIRTAAAVLAVAGAGLVAELIPGPSQPNSTIPSHTADVARSLALATSSSATLPPGVVLSYPGAPYVKLVPGCTWGTGAKSLSINRPVGQPINVVNVDSLPHKWTQVSGRHSSIPWWGMKQYEVIGFIWNSPTTIVLTTCSGTVKLTVVVS